MIGLLLDSLSQNTGDQAILQVMLQFLKAQRQEFEVASPLGFDAERYGQIIVGGGHLIREKGDWYYDPFRVPGRHILNVAGVSTSSDLDYLAEYAYVSVRSSKDRARVVSAAPAAVVSPCVSLRLEPEDGELPGAEGAIGFHFHERSWAACGDESLFLQFKDYRQCLLPITHYNGDYWLLRNLGDRIPVEHTLLPRLEPRRVLHQISHMRALVCSSLHASIFAYSQNVPFIVFGEPDKIVEFMEDRGLQDWIFRDGKELHDKLAALLDKPPDYSEPLKRDLKTLDEHFRRLADCFPRGQVPVDQNSSPRMPSTEHRLLVEHHNRIAVLERIADRLIASAERMESDASRQESRLNQLRLAAQPATIGDSLVLAGAVTPGLSRLPFGSVEVPAAEARIYGTCEASGWALCESGISEVVAYIDGKLAATAEYGNPRADVARAYPGFPDSRRPGWKLTINTRSLPEGAYEVLLQARSRTGLTRDLAVLPIIVASQKGSDPTTAVFVDGGTETSANRKEVSSQAHPISEELAQAVDALASRVQELEHRRETFDVVLQKFAQQNVEIVGKVDGALAALRSQETIHIEAADAKVALESAKAQVRAHEDQITSSAEAIAALLREAESLKCESAPLQERVKASEESVSTCSERTTNVAYELTSLSQSLASVPQQLTVISEAARCSQAALDQLRRDNLAAVRKVVNALLTVESHLQANSDPIRAPYQSRIRKTLKALAAPFDRLLGRPNTSNRSIPLSEARGIEHLLDESAAPMVAELPPAGPAPSLPIVASSVRRSETQAPQSGKGDNSEPENTLRLGIDCGIPESICVAKGNALYLHGWCYHPNRHISRLEIVAGKARHPVKVYGTVRSDVFSKHFPHLDSKGHSFRSGFWGIIPFAERHREEEVTLCLCATLETGERSTCKIATTTLLPGPLRSPLKSGAGSGDSPLVAICMATYNPPLVLFRRQIESLIRQSFRNWICLISDDCSRPETFAEICAITNVDARFHVFHTPERLGFYRNFEYCLSLAPQEATFVALCDHDDAWYPDKLESLLSAFGPGTSLAYSDMRIVEGDGHVVADTYWTTRANNYRSFTSLLIANTVTGAASMLRRDLLNLVLPFPDLPGEPFHDHWMACVGLATGKIAYVDRPLYDYVQHTRNVIGHFAPGGVSWVRNAWLALRNRTALDQTMAFWRNIYFGDVLRIEMIATILELRCGEMIPRHKRRLLRHLRRMDDEFVTAIWLLLRRGRELWRGNETLAAETRLLRGVLWKYGSILRSRLGSGPVMDTLQITTPSSATPSVSRILDTVDVIRQKITPLKLAIAPTEIRRVNLLIPTIDFDYVFGGYIAKFCLAQRLADMGFRVRIVIVDYCDYKPAFWRRQLRSFEGIASVLDSCELAYAFDRAAALTVSPTDSFIATTWWTAHIAREATKDLGHREFLYLIQEYEPFTFPMGTFASLARETYSWPHRALFSTRFLQEYFRQERLGVFARCDGDTERAYAVFDNAITDVGHITPDALRFRRTRKLLFYGRPEGHAARNMFELGILALCTAIEAGTFDNRWEFTGIGSIGPASRVPLANGRYMQLLTRQSQAEYKKVLLAHDLGLSLMYTPHPSLAPIEMASAGMMVVTNTFCNKTREALRCISKNIVAAQPTVEELAAGLRAAVASIDLFDERAAGATVNWCRDWNQAFNKAVLSRIGEFLKEISE